MEENFNEKQEVENEKKDGTSLRKSNKPLMEKRRRARINSCLSQLKSLVLQAMQKDSSQFSKLEKADILEMTVKHLRQMQRQQIHTAVSCDPTVATKYRTGFSQCASEVLRYLDTAQGVNETVKSRLVGHLSACVDSVHAPEVQMAPPQQHIQPLQLQIPLAGQTQTLRPGSLIMPTQKHTSQDTTIDQQHHMNKDNSTSPVTTQMTGTFKLVPSNVCNGAVAVYLGHACSDSQSDFSVPVYSIQVPQDNGSVGAYSQQQQSLENDDACLRIFSSQKSIHRTISPICNSAAEAFKPDIIWRPW